MDILKLEAVKKGTFGTTMARRMRAEGRVPAIIYGHGENVMCELKEADLKALLITPKVYLIELSVEGKVEHVILKEVQYHPVSDRPLHLDFYRYADDEPIVMAIPVDFQGHARGVRAGGKLVAGVRRLKVRGLAANLPDILPIDVTNLRIGDALMVSDISFENLDVVESRTVLVASIKSQRGASNNAVEDEGDESDSAETESSASE